jgi:hypothetical protein
MGTWRRVKLLLATIFGKGGRIVHEPTMGMWTKKPTRVFSDRSGFGDGRIADEAQNVAAGGIMSVTDIGHEQPVQPASSTDDAEKRPGGQGRAKKYIAKRTTGTA